MYSLVEIGKTYTSKLIRISKDMVKIGLHSYADLIEDLRNKHALGLIIAKCIIPTGSNYYEGTYGGYIR